MGSVGRGQPLHWANGADRARRPKADKEGQGAASEVGGRLEGQRGQYRRITIFPKQRLRGGVLTFYVHKLVDDAGFSGRRRLGPGCGLWLADSGAGRLAVAGSLGRRSPAVAVAGAFWCRCGAYG